MHVMAINTKKVDAIKFSKIGSEKKFWYITDNNHDDMLLSSCSITFQNNLYVFGGVGSFVDQVSKLINFRFVVIGRLEFHFIHGACANAGNKFIYLCFHLGNDDDMKLCRHATQPDGSFLPIEKSDHTHARISIAASECE